jgi:hypothetical protein
LVRRPGHKAPAHAPPDDASTDKNGTVTASGDNPATYAAPRP